MMVLFPCYLMGLPASASRFLLCRWEAEGHPVGAASLRLDLLGGAAPEPPGYLRPNDEVCECAGRDGVTGLQPN